MQPEEIDEMPAADDDLHPDTVLDEANNAAQLAAIDAATHNHLHSENARLAAARGMGRSANAVPRRADGSVVAGDFTFNPLPTGEVGEVLKEPDQEPSEGQPFELTKRDGYDKNAIRDQYLNALKKYDLAVVERLLTVNGISPTGASIGTILNIIPTEVSTAHGVE